MQPGSTRLVKKYANRRLYDTFDSRYITMDELVSRIRAGTEVRVVDAQNGEDLTQATLTQLIIDARGAGRFFSVPLLSQLIRMGDDALADFLGRYLTAALGFYLQARQGAQAIAPYNPLATMPFVAANALSRLFQFVPGWGPGAGGPMPDAMSPPPVAAASDAQSGSATEGSASLPTPVPRPATEASIEALRRELDALRAQMVPRPRKPAKRSLLPRGRARARKR